jgi:hypothetical protein
MDGSVFVIALTAIGCGTGIIITAMEKFSDSRKRAREHELRLTSERLQQQELQIIELRRQNELLQKQIEWSNRLLEAQQRPPSGAHETPAIGDATRRGYG